MQNKNEYNVKERSKVYASGIMYNALRVGDNYLDVPKTIVIWILGFNSLKMEVIMRLQELREILIMKI